MHRQLRFALSRTRPKASVSEKQEAKWVRQLCAGEPAAWAALVDHWSPRLYNYVLYNGASEAEAQQLLVAIFAAMAEAVVGSLRVANLTVLIFSIACQHMLRFRQQASYPVLEPSLLSVQSEPTAVRFLNNLYHFTPEVQQVLLLHYLCGVSLAEISQIVGQREEILAKLLHRAKFHLVRAK